MQQQPFALRELLLAAIVFAIAGGLRGGYVYVVLQDLQQPPPLQVQDAETAVRLVRGESK